MKLFRDPIKALTQDPVEYKNLLLCGLSSVLANGFATRMLNATAAPFNVAVGLDTDMQAICGLVFQVVNVTMMIVAVLFVDRIRRRIGYNAILLALSVLVAGVGSLVKCLGPVSFRAATPVFIINIVTNVPMAVFGALYASSNGIVECRIIHNEIRGRFWSMFGIITGLCGLLAGLLTTSLLKRYDVFFATVVLTIPGMVLNTVAAWLMYKVKELPDLQSVELPKGEPVLQSLKNIAFMRQFRIMMPANFMRGLGNGAAGYAMYLALKNWGLPQEYAGYQQAVAGFAPFAGWILLGLTNDRFGPGLVLPVTDAVMALSLVGMVAYPSGKLLITCIFIWETLMITEGAAIPLAHYEVVPREVFGAFSSVRLMLMHFSGTISGSVFGFLLKSYPPLLIFAICALVKLSAGFLYSYGIYSLRGLKNSNPPASSKTA